MFGPLKFGVFSDPPYEGEGGGVERHPPSHDIIHVESSIKQSSFLGC